MASRMSSASGALRTVAPAVVATMPLPPAPALSNGLVPDGVSGDDFTVFPIPTRTSMLPLSGLRVIAVEQYGAGPFGSMLLADLGAEVIKIENPAEGGDVSRSVGPHFFVIVVGYLFQSLNSDKMRLTLNLIHQQVVRVCLTF